MESKLNKVIPLSSDYAYSIKITEDGKLEREWEIGGFEKITGYTPGELYEKGGYAALIHPDDLKQAEKRVQKQLKGETVVSEMRVYCKDGSVKWIRDTGMPEWDDKKEKVIRIIGVAKDITAEKQNQEALKKKEEDLLFLMESTHELYACNTADKLYEYAARQLYILTREQCYVSIVDYDIGKGSWIMKAFEGLNPFLNSLMELLGFDVRSMTGKINPEVIKSIEPGVLAEQKEGISNLTNGKIPQKLENKIAQLLKLNKIYIFPFQKNGNILGNITFLTKENTSLPDTEILGFFVKQLSANLEKLKSVQELDKAEKQIKIVNDNLNEVIWQVDRNAIFNYVSPSCKKIIGYTIEEMLEKSVFDFFPKSEHTKAKEALIENVNKVKNNEVLGSRDYFMIHKNGELIPVEISASPLFDKNNELIGFTGVTRDISLRHELSQELERKESNLRSLVENAEGYVIYRTRLNRISGEIEVVEVSPNFTEVLGISDADKYNFQQWFAHIHPEDLPGLMAASEKGMKPPFQLHLEVRGIHPELGLRWYEIRSKGVPFRDDPETIEFANGIILDITDRKNTEKSLKDSEQNFRSLAESASVLISIISVKEGTKYLYTNKHWEKIMGYTREDLKTLKPIDTVHPDMREMVMDYALKRVQGENVAERYELKAITKTGDIRILDFSSKLIEFAGENALLTTGVDITKLKKIEQNLKESENRYKSLVNHSLDGIFVLQDGKVVFANPAVILTTGYPENEVVHREFKDYIHPDDRKEVFEKQRKRLMGESVPPYDFRIVKKNGEAFWIRFSANLVEWNNKTGILCFASNINERKKAEQRVVRNEHMLSQYIDQSRDAIVLVNEKGRIIAWNKKQEEYSGYAFDEIRHLSIWDVQHKMIGEELRRKMPLEKIRQVLLHYVSGAKDKSWTGDRSEIELVHKNGTQRRVEQNIFPIIFEQEVLLASINKDVTDIRKAEHALEQSELKFRQLFNKMQAGVAIYDALKDGEDFVISDMNEAGLKIGGQKRKEVIGKKLTEVYPGVKEMGLFEVLKRVYASGQPESFPIRHYQDKRMDLWAENYVYKLPEGQVIAVYEDLTAQKVAEMELKESETKYKQLITQMSEGLMQTDLQDNILFVNQQFCEMLGYEEKEVIGKKGYEFLVFPEDVKTIKQKNKNRGADIKERYSIRLKRKDGGFLWTQITGSPLKNRQGEVVNTLGIITDITRLKEAEFELTKSEEQYRALFENSTNPMLIISDFVFVSCNGAAVDFLQYGREEEIHGKHPHELSPERQPDGSLSAEKSIQYIQQAMQKGNARFEWMHQNVKGEDIWVDVSLTYIPSKDIIHTIWRDISARKKFEQELRRSKDQISALFDHMTNSFAYHKIILGEQGEAIDYEFVEVNKAFEEEIGMDRKDILGKKVTQLLPGTENDPADWIGKYGKVAITGESIDFENYSEAMQKWFHVRAYSPEKDYFATSFEDITERKLQEEELRKHREELEVLVKERTKELEEKNQELERMNDVFVGREFRIKDLKDQMTELKQKLRRYEG
jgi:PAS domain S-box-containing protein